MESAFLQNRKKKTIKIIFSFFVFGIYKIKNKKDFCKRKRKLKNKEMESAFLQNRKKKTIEILIPLSCLGFTKSKTKTTFAIKRSYKKKNWKRLFCKKRK